MRAVAGIRNRKSRNVVFSGALAVALAASMLTASCRAAVPIAAPEPPLWQSITTLRLAGGQVDWSPSENLIAYDAPGLDGNYQVHVMAPDGSGDRCLTCGRLDLPRGHRGGAAWHPQGHYIVFLAEKANHPGLSYQSLPGFGQFCDLWAITPDGKQLFRLTNLPNIAGNGVLMPHFSPDGYYLSWGQMKTPANIFDPTQREAAGYWTLRVARFDEIGGRPQLTQEKIYEPAPDTFYENDGFTPDGTHLIFTGNPDKQSVWQSQVYLVDLASGAISSRLTSGSYNEHAVYTPDGTQILWMSNAGNGNNGPTDWWIMNADGSNPKRLTYFNQFGSGQYRAKVWATDASFSPDGRSFAGYIQTNLITQRGYIVKVQLK